MQVSNKNFGLFKTLVKTFMLKNFASLFIQKAIKAKIR